MWAHYDFTLYRPDLSICSDARRRPLQVYYPAVSLYKAATVTFNFGPTFQFPPPANCSARPACELANPDLHNSAPGLPSSTSTAGRLGVAPGGEAVDLPSPEDMAADVTEPAEATREGANDLPSEGDAKDFGKRGGKLKKNDGQCAV